MFPFFHSRSILCWSMIWNAISKHLLFLRECRVFTSLLAAKIVCYFFRCSTAMRRVGRILWPIWPCPQCKWLSTAPGAPYKPAMTRYVCKTNIRAACLIQPHKLLGVDRKKEKKCFAPFSSYGQRKRFYLVTTVCFFLITVFVNN